MRQIIAISETRYVVVEQTGDRMVLQRLPGDFRAVRLVLGIEQRELARMLSVSPAALSLIERGHRRFSARLRDRCLERFPGLIQTLGI